MAVYTKKLLSFFLMFFTIIGVIGGIGYTIYYGAYFISFCLVVVGFTSYPMLKEYIDNLKM